MSLFEVPTTYKYTHLFVPKSTNFQMKMEQVIHIKYVNSLLNIGLVNWRDAWDISGIFPKKLQTEFYKGNLVFRKKGCTKHISYKQLKKGLIKKETVIQLESLPF
jgi:hypothetical protein